VNLRALARDIGVSHAAPSRQFQSRADLFTAIAREGVEALAEAAFAHLKNGGLGNLEKLQVMVRAYMGWARANPVYHLVLRNQDVMRHADEQLVSVLEEYATLQKRTIELAQNEGWRCEKAVDQIFLEIIAFTAGLAIVATDPMYKVPLGDKIRERDLDEAVYSFFR